MEVLFTGVVYGQRIHDDDVASHNGNVM